MSTTFPPDSFIPATLNAGETWQFTLSLLQYPATQGWTAKIYAVGNNIANQGANNYSFQATTDPDGTDYDFLVSAATTAPIVPGIYDYRVLVFGSGAFAGQTFCAIPYTPQGGQARFVVAPNFQTLTNFNPLSQSETELAAIQATILTLETNVTASATFGGQTFTIQRIVELQQREIRLKERIKAEAVANNIAAGRASGRQVQARFVDAYPQSAWNPYWWTH